jgi:ornithine carbamoyltransferase
MKHFLSIADLSDHELKDLIDFSLVIKRKPHRYTETLKGKQLLMLFAKPSLRTRLSFEVGMRQLGGDAINYQLSESTVGSKETIEDMAKTASNYVDAIMARLYSHADLVKIACNSKVPVINGLTDHSHPCQALADVLTIIEEKRDLDGVRLVYYGDGSNNTCHSLMFACSKLGIHMIVACPKQKELMPDPRVSEIAKEEARKHHSLIEVMHDPYSAAANADAVYTDSWMSYHIKPKEHDRRKRMLSRFQVDTEKMSLAHKNAIFLHCLPAQRGEEVTAQVIDGPQSRVFQQAENRLHAQKALLIRLLK